MTTADKILALGEQIDSLIYHKKNWNDLQHNWLVQLKYIKRVEASKLEIEITAEDVNLEVAMAVAWDKFNAALANLEPVKLLPAIEHAKIRRDRGAVRSLSSAPKSLDLDDEIPF